MSSTSSALSARPWLSAYADGVPRDIGEVTETLVDLLEGAVSRSGKGVALEFFGAETTYRELGEQVARVAEGLRRLGVRRGDRVALVLPNCPQHVVAFFAVLRLGAIVVEHNPLSTEAELGRQFADHGARHAVVWDKAVDRVCGAESGPDPKRTVRVSLVEAMPRRSQLALKLPVPKARAARERLAATPETRGLVPWSRLVGTRRLPRRAARPTLDDTALIQYTSGTTGTPKGAILSHRNLRANAMQGEAWVPGLRHGDEAFYAVLPMFHAYGLTLCLTFAVSIGARVVLFPTFDVDLVLDAAKRTPPTFLPAVPPIYDQLARASSRPGVDLTGIRFAISGAMSLHVSTVERWEEATGGLLVEGYGMTEASPVALGNPVGPSRRPGTVGVPFPSTEIRVVEKDDPEVDVEMGEPGELLVRGPQVFQGYWNRPDDTAAALTRDGWLRTGDVVTVSPDGFVTVVDRVKELIITGGFNVSPTEVEALLVEHPDVTAAAVVGLPRRDGGEDVAAAVVLRDGAELDVTGLREFCRARLSAYKVPKRIVAVDDLPRSLIGKVLRREVAERIRPAG